MVRKRYGFRRSRRYWYADQGANDEGYTTRYCAPCQQETEHEGSYCIPCWDRKNAEQQRHSER